MLQILFVVIGRVAQVEGLADSGLVAYQVDYNLGITIGNNELEVLVVF